MKHLITAVFTVLLAGQACAFFSEHAIITPENLAKHEEFKVWLYHTKEDPDMVNVVLPFHDGGKNYWLVSCKRELQDNEMIFREFVWYSHKRIPGYIQSITPITPILDRTGSVPEGAFIRLKIRKDALASTYIYHDYPMAVDDGGWYRTYRLSAFPIGTGIDPIMELEWEISHFHRTGDNPKHRAAEHKLREMLADEDFMAKWGKRYKAEQDGAEEAAAVPELKSEDGREPESESKGRSR